MFSVPRSTNSSATPSLPASVNAAPAESCSNDTVSMFGERAVRRIAHDGRGARHFGAVSFQQLAFDAGLGRGRPGRGFERNVREATEILSELHWSARLDWAGLGIGGAVWPEPHIRKAPSAALVYSDAPVLLQYEAVWRKDLLVAEHSQAFVDYLRRVVPRIVEGIVP